MAEEIDDTQQDSQDAEQTAEQTDSPQDQGNVEDAGTQPDSQDAEQKDAKSDLPENQVDVEDVGTLKKKIAVTIPRKRIDAKQDEMFGELSSSAQVPGFRIGRAPRRLIEKRFGKEITEDVRNSLIGEAIGDAIEKSDLKTIGEPDIDLDGIELPDAGDMAFSFQVEVAPQFDLPELKAIAVEKQIVQVTDERIDAQIDQWVAGQATYEPTDEAAHPDDVVVAGAKITVEGADQPTESPGLHLRVAPGQIEGIPLLDLGKVLAGAKAGESVSLQVSINDAHPNEQWRGKNATVEIDVSQVQRRVMPKVDDDLAKAAGFESLAELREYLRSRAESQLVAEVQRSMRHQVEQYLLDNTDFDLPAGVAKRHADRLLQRRLVSLLEQGVPRERIDERLTELQAAIGEQARRDLKLRFILEKVAADREIEVTPEEVNSRIAQIASLYKRRPEKLRHELTADGTLQELEIGLRDEKAVESLLAEAEITEVKEQEKSAEKTSTAKATKAAKKTKKAEKAKKAQKADKPAEADKPDATKKPEAAEKAKKAQKADKPAEADKPDAAKKPEAVEKAKKAKPAKKADDEGDKD